MRVCPPASPKGCFTPTTTPAAASAVRAAAPAAAGGTHEAPAAATHGASPAPDARKAATFRSATTPAHAPAAQAPPTHRTPATEVRAPATNRQPPRPEAASPQATGTTDTSPAQATRHATPTPSPSAAVRVLPAPTSAASDVVALHVDCRVTFVSFVEAGVGGRPRRRGGRSCGRPAVALAPAPAAPRAKTRTAPTCTAPPAPVISKGAPHSDGPARALGWRPAPDPFHGIRGTYSSRHFKKRPTSSPTDSTARRTTTKA